MRHYSTKALLLALLLLKKSGQRSISTHNSEIRLKATFLHYFITPNRRNHPHSPNKKDIEFERILDSLPELRIVNWGGAADHEVA
jgi:hypothetical protein